MGSIFLVIEGLGSLSLFSSLNSAPLRWGFFFSGIP